MREFVVRYSTAIFVTLGILLLGALIWGVWRVLPPREFTILTGREGGAYYLAAQEYQKIAAEKGFRLNIRPTAGSVEVVDLLMQGEAGIGIVQGGAAADADAESLNTMSSIFYEPLWFFYRSEAFDGTPPTRLNDLQGKRLSVGEQGSGTNLLARSVLAEVQVDAGNTDFVDLSTADSIAALADGSIDGAFVVSSPTSPRIAELFALPGVALMDMEQADAYAARHGFLTELLLPAGTVDLVANIPPQDTRLLATVANVVVRSDFHPDLLRLMTLAVVRTHSEGGIFEERGEFPNFQHAELPVSSAELAYVERIKSGDSTLDNYLPFWAAALVDRYLLFFLPVALFLIPILSRSPLVVQFFFRRRILRAYDTVRAAELRINTLPIELVDDEIERLAALDQRLARAPRVPQDYMPEVYDLRMHIERTIERLRRREDAARVEAAAQSNAGAAASPVASTEL